MMTAIIMLAVFGICVTMTGIAAVALIIEKHPTNPQPAFGVALVTIAALLVMAFFVTQIVTASP